MRIAFVEGRLVEECINIISLQGGGRTPSTHGRREGGRACLMDYNGKNIIKQLMHGS